MNNNVIETQVDENEQIFPGCHCPSYILRAQDFFSFIV